MPTTSVIIQTYNHEQYLGRCIQSILDQTFQDFEIIIVDDGSSYDVKSYTQSFLDRRINFIQSSRLGVSHGLNSAINISKGRILEFISGDDFAFKNRLEAHHNLSNLGNYLYFSKPLVVDPFGNTTYPQPQMFKNFQDSSNTITQLRELLNNTNFLCASTFFAHRDTIKKIGFFDTTLLQLQDFDYWVRALLSDIRIYVAENEVSTCYTWSNSFDKSVTADNLSGPHNTTRINRELTKFYIDLVDKIDSGTFFELFPNNSRFFTSDLCLNKHLNHTHYLANHSVDSIRAIAYRVLERYFDSHNDNGFLKHSILNALFFLKNKSA